MGAGPLVRGAHLHPSRRSLMIAFVSFANDLGATLIAECVEIDEEAAVLRTWGVRFGQGWLYGRPQPLPLTRAGGVRPDGTHGPVGPGGPGGSDGADGRDGADGADGPGGSVLAQGSAPPERRMAVAGGRAILTGGERRRQ